MSRHAHPSDLSDAEFRWVEAWLPPPCSTGRPRVHAQREILDAIFSVVRTGCQWRFLPADFPPWSTVYGWFRRWRLDGTWERVHTALREHVRLVVGRAPQPSAAIINRQSVTTTSVGGVHGYDGATKLRGRMRHVLVDTRAWSCATARATRGDELASRRPRGVSHGRTTAGYGFWVKSNAPRRSFAAASRLPSGASAQRVSISLRMEVVS